MIEVMIESKLEILNSLIERLKCPLRWTKKRTARDKSGLAVHSTDPNAASWCVSGALISVAWDDYNWFNRTELHSLILETIIMSNQPGGGYSANGSIAISDWNDHPDTTHEMVMDILHKTKEKL